MTFLLGSVLTRRWNLVALAERAGMAMLHVTVLIGGAIVLAPAALIAAIVFGAVVCSFGAVRLAERAAQSLRQTKPAAGSEPLPRQGEPIVSAARTLPPGGATRTLAAGDRRSGTLLATGRTRRATAATQRSLAAPSQQRRPKLEPIDFQRSIDAMVRHRWQGEAAVHQLEGLGARWVWRRRGKIEPRGDGTLSGTPATPDAEPRSSYVLLRPQSRE